MSQHSFIVSHDVIPIQNLYIRNNGVPPHSSSISSASSYASEIKLII